MLERTLLRVVCKTIDVLSQDIDNNGDFRKASQTLCAVVLMELDDRESAIAAAAHPWIKGAVNLDLYDVPVETEPARERKSFSGVGLAEDEPIGEVVDETPEDVKAIEGEHPGCCEEWPWCDCAEAPTAGVVVISNPPTNGDLWREQRAEMTKEAFEHLPPCHHRWAETTADVAEAAGEYDPFQDESEAYFQCLDCRQIVSEARDKVTVWTDPSGEPEPEAPQVVAETGIRATEQMATLELMANGADEPEPIPQVTPEAPQAAGETPQVSDAVSDTRERLKTEFRELWGSREFTGTEVARVSGKPASWFANRANGHCWPAEDDLALLKEALAKLAQAESEPPSVDPDPKPNVEPSAEPEAPAPADGPRRAVTFTPHVVLRALELMAEGKSDNTVSGCIGVQFPVYDGEPYNSQDIAQLRARKWADLGSLTTAKALSTGQFQSVKEAILSDLKAQGGVTIEYVPEVKTC